MISKNDEKVKGLEKLKIEHPPRIRLSAKESLKRTQEFDKRKERFIAAIRKARVEVYLPNV
jgi:hypothetical protein